MRLQPVIYSGLLMTGALSAAAQTPGPAYDPFMPSRPDHAPDYQYISVHDDGAERFFPVGRLQPTPTGGGCTGAVIASEPPPPKDAPALLLTAGHCTTWTGDPNEVIIHRPAEGSFTPAFFQDNVEKFRQYRVVETVYSTMKVTDIAILKLDVTYGELLDHGIKPLTLARWDSTVKDVESAHASYGSWLQYSGCEVAGEVALTESLTGSPKEYPFFAPRNLSTNCAGIFAGASGAAVIKKGTTEVIAVMSTGNVWGELRCGACEIIDGQRIPFVDVIYIAQTDALVDALLPDGSVDISRLDPGTGAKLIPRGGWTTIADAARPETTRWNLEVDPSFELMRYKTGIAGATECSDPAGYSEPVPVAEQPLYKLPIPPRQNVTVHVMCVVGKRPQTDQWQAFSHATSLLHELTVPVARQRQ